MAEIRHPIRLPILLALADEHLSPSQLAERLDADEQRALRDLLRKALDKPA